MGKPIIYKTSCSIDGISDLNSLTGDQRKYLLEYPTVYVLNSNKKRSRIVNTMFMLGKQIQLPIELNSIFKRKKTIK